MKKCSYCGRDNENNATNCHECGTEFVDAHAQAAREAIEIDSGVLPDEESATAVPTTASQQRSASFPFEYWIFFGIALSASGYFYSVFAAIIFYLLFMRLQPSADWELLMVASSFTGVGIFRII
jgi:hypothetical protein